MCVYVCVFMKVYDYWYGECGEKKIPPAKFDGEENKKKNNKPEGKGEGA